MVTWKGGSRNEGFLVGWASEEERRVELERSFPSDPHHLPSFLLRPCRLLPPLQLQPNELDLLFLLNRRTTPTTTQQEEQTIQDDDLLPPSPPLLPLLLERNRLVSDGNIILQVENTDFKVYRGVLASQSKVFEDMFRLAGEGAEEEEGGDLEEEDESTSEKEERVLPSWKHDEGIATVELLQDVVGAWEAMLTALYEEV